MEQSAATASQTGLRVVLSDPGDLEALRESVGEHGYYALSRTDQGWDVKPLRPAPVWIQESGVRRVSGGLIGDPTLLDDHIDTWPDYEAVGAEAEVDKAIEELHASERPDTAFELALRHRLAHDALLGARPKRIPEVAMRVAEKFLEWYPKGQFVFWKKNYEYMKAMRGTHLLAAIEVSGIESVRKVLAPGDERKSIWFSGEDIAVTHPASIYANLSSRERLGGLAWETLPLDIVFEFGDDLELTPGQFLDYLSITHLHSLSSVEYFPLNNLHRNYPFVAVDPVHRDALRAWFVEHFGLLSQYLAAWENFKTKTGELQPLVQQQVQMTVARIIHASAHLLASTERYSELSLFWDLVDLYATFNGENIVQLFSRRFFDKVVVPAMETLPGVLGGLYAAQAINLLDEWAEQAIAGITDRSVVTGSSVKLTVATKEIYYDRYLYLGHHVAARRDTLHGYSFSNWLASDKHRIDAALLGLHDGSLPLRLSEWGRLMLFVLLADPHSLIHKDQLKPR